MTPSSTGLRCAHCGRELHKHSISTAPGRRVHIVSKGTFQENNLQTFDDIYLACEGACDHALRTTPPQEPWLDIPSDFLNSDDEAPFEEWESLTDIVGYTRDWLARWADRARCGGISEESLAFLRKVASLLKDMERAENQKNAS